MYPDPPSVPDPLSFGVAGRCQTCAFCRLVVIREEHADGSALVREPSFVERRFLRSYFGPSFFSGARWGVSWPTRRHVCDSFYPARKGGRL